MRENGGGSIVITSSIGGEKGFALESIYCMSKGAVLQLARSIAIEYRDQGPDPLGRLAGLLDRFVEGVEMSLQRVSAGIGFAEPNAVVQRTDKEPLEGLALVPTQDAEGYFVPVRLLDNQSGHFHEGIGASTQLDLATEGGDASRVGTQVHLDGDQLFRRPITPIITPRTASIAGRSLRGIPAQVGSTARSGRRTSGAGTKSGAGSATTTTWGTPRAPSKSWASTRVPAGTAVKSAGTIAPRSTPRLLIALVFGILGGGGGVGGRLLRPGREKGFFEIYGKVEGFAHGGKGVAIRAKLE